MVALVNASHDALLTKPEAAQLLRVCPRTISNLIKRRLLPVVKIGSAVRFNRADLESFVQAQTKGSAR